MRVLYPLLLLLLMLFAGLPAVSQVEWARIVGSVGPDNLEKHTLDPQGNVVAVGYYGGPLRLGDHQLPFTDGTEIFLFKASPDGEILWAKSLYGPSWGGDCSVATDAQGNIFVAGGFVHELYHEGSRVLAGTKNWNSFVSKFDTNGQLLWIRGILGQAGTLSQARVMGNLAVNPAGEVVIAGNYGGTVELSGTIISNSLYSSSSNFFIARYTADGNLRWLKTPYSETNVEPRAIQIDEQQKIYITGAYTGSVHFDATVLRAANAQHSDIFLVTYQADGQVAWAKGFNKVQLAHQINNAGRALVVEPGSGAIYMAADFKSDILLDGNVLPSFARSWGDDSNTGSDILLAKFASDGALIWVQRQGSAEGHDYPCDLQLDKNGQVIVAGAGGGGIGAPFFRHFSSEGIPGKEYVFFSGQALTSVSHLIADTYYVSQRFQHLLVLDPFSFPEVTSGASYGEGDGVLFKISSESNRCALAGSMPPVPDVQLKCRELELVGNAESYTIQWYRNGQVLEGQHEPRLLFEEGGVYTASLSNACDIRYSQEVVAGPPNGSGISLYNVVTPNGDGDNDALMLPESLAGSAIRIYNRWGKEIYKSLYYENDWKGTDLPTGTYYYIVINQCFGRYTSPLTIIR